MTSEEKNGREEVDIEYTEVSYSLMNQSPRMERGSVTFREFMNTACGRLIDRTFGVSYRSAPCIGGKHRGECYTVDEAFTSCGIKPISFDGEEIPFWYNWRRHCLYLYFGHAS